MKRTVDAIMAILLLIVLSPILLTIYILIKLESKGPALFKQQRIGKEQRPFTIYKFRTMHVNTPNVATDRIDHSIYVTRLGKFLRKTSLDELPQLFNVVKGDMSFVGPRPALYNQYELISMREGNGVHSVRPGITGLAQVNGRDEIVDIEKVKWDRLYVETRGFLVDIKIILKTFSTVFGSTNIKG